MVNVVLSSDNITVLGGPSKLGVDLNIGATGRRGSLFFTGNGNPNLLNQIQDFPLTPILFDIFINVNPSSNDYLRAYQYINQDGQNNWIPIFSINQNVYSENKVLDFKDGEASINIDVSALGLNRLPFDTLADSFSHFNVQATLSNVNLENLSLTPFPSAISVKVGDAYFDNTGSTDSGKFPLFLPLSFQAVEFSGTSWIPIDDKKTVVFLTISFANPKEIVSIISNGGEN
jgi:hypothetical protein